MSPAAGAATPGSAGTSRRGGGAVLHARVAAAAVAEQRQHDQDHDQNDDEDHKAQHKIAAHDELGETLDHMAEDLMPNRLTEYLYALAETFNHFFRDCRVEGTPEQNSRLLLTEATGRVLKQGMDLLGLVTVDRM